MPVISCPSVERGASQARRWVRRKPKRRRQHSSREGVLVLLIPSLLTRRRRRKGLAACLSPSVKPGADGCDRGRQRLRIDLGVRLKTPSSGDPARRSSDRSSTRPAQGPHPGCRQSFGSARFSGVSLLRRSWSIAVKRGSTRELTEVIGRGRLCTGKVARLSRCARESDTPEGARFGSRLQKLVRRIFLARSGSRGNSRAATAG